MKITELKSEIMSDNLKNLYVFVGEEIGIQKIYMEQIAKRKSLQILRKNSVAEVAGAVQSTGFFSNEPALYIVREDKDFQKEEKVWEQFCVSIGDSCVILLYTKIDSRMKFGKHFKDNIVEFEKLDRPVLMKYIKNAGHLSDKNADRMAQICGDSYDVAMLECEKIKDFSRIEKSEPDWCFETLVKDGTIYQSQETDVFAFTDAVCLRKKSDSFKLAAILKESGVSSITSLGTLYSSMRAIMLIQCCEGKNIAEITGLDKGAIWYNQKRTGRYTTYELVDCVKLIANTVSNIKSGLIDDEYAVDYVLCNIL